MATGLILHSDFLLHLNGPRHPERPQRLEAIELGLTRSGLLARMNRLEPREAEVEELTRVHHPRYVDRVRRVAQVGGGDLDPETTVCPESWHVARLAAGGSIVALEAVLDGQVDNALVIPRPPGHHARPDQGMGFCLFNNIAIAARAAQQRGVERLFILDWDVHHGNGTQDAFYRDGNVFFCSLHQSPWFPFTGYYDETGEGPGEGATRNIPLAAGQTTADYLELFDETVLPLIRAFNPELILVSAGQDIHERDPLGGMLLQSADFATFTRRVLDVAAGVCEGRTLFVLEGGYELLSLTESTCAIATELLNQ